MRTISRYFGKISRLEIVVAVICGVFVFLSSKLIFSIYFSSENREILFLLLCVLIGVEVFGYFLLRSRLIRNASSAIHRVLGTIYGSFLVVVILIFWLLIIG